MRLLKFLDVALTRSLSVLISQDLTLSLPLRVSSLLCNSYIIAEIFLWLANNIPRVA